MNDDDKKNIIALLVFSLVIFFFVSGYYFGKSKARFDNEGALERLDKYLGTYAMFFGKENCVRDTEILGFSAGKSVPTIPLSRECTKKNEGDFRNVLNLVNIPGQVWNENLTVNEAIIQYDKWAPPSRSIMEIVLKDICTG